MNLLTKTTLFVTLMTIMISSARAETAKAQISNTREGGSVTGSILFEDTEAGLHISGEAQGLKPGKHGFHIHEFGNCAEEGKAAGSHFNPQGAPHGYLPEQKLKSAHAGDLGNLEVSENGTAALDLTVAGLSVAGNPFAVSGRSVIIHEKEDDFSQPLGNAGGRVGCGVITITPSEKKLNTDSGNPGK